MRENQNETRRNRDNKIQIETHRRLNEKGLQRDRDKKNIFVGKK